MPVSFATDIRPLFRDSPDVDSMQGYGLDLSPYEEVRARPSEIYARLADGSMPCDEPWPPERLALFKRWMGRGLRAVGFAQPLRYARVRVIQHRQR